MNMCARFSIKPPGWLEKLRIDERESRYSDLKPASIAKSLAVRIFTPWRLSRRRNHKSH